MIYGQKWRDAEVRRNFGVLTLSFQMARRIASHAGDKKSGRLFSLAKILGGNSLNCCHEKRVKQRILDAFEYEIEQEWINKLVLSIQQRLKDCLSRDVAFTGW